MFTLLRRLLWLGLLAGAGSAGWIIWQRQHAPTPAAAPEWPPLPPVAERAVADTDITDITETATAETPQRWVEPVDGACPDGYPIKANDKSGIFHAPGGRFYDRTVPDRCYADPVDAETDGYRAAKV